MSHTGERASCNVTGCTKSYSNFANLRRHERDKHKDSKTAFEREVRDRKIEERKRRKLEEENQRIADITEMLYRETKNK